MKFCIPSIAVRRDVVMGHEKRQEAIAELIPVEQLPGEIPHDVHSQLKDVLVGGIAKEVKDAVAVPKGQDSLKSTRHCRQFRNCKSEKHVRYQGGSTLPGVLYFS